ncbi:MAG: HAD family hydrolase [Oscillospiraceae bacterium]|nr:HAD family hydrolase [Oscillospiraceae bacterium]
MSDFSNIVFISDLDGTLLPDSKVPLEKDMEAIERFKNGGGIFTIATGRIIQAADQFFDVLKPNAPVILNNGSLIYDTETGERLYNCTLDKAAKDYTIALMERFPEMGVEINLPDRIYAVRLNDWERKHLELTHIPYTEAGIDDIPAEGWCKVLYSIAHERLNEVESYAASMGWDKANFVISGDFLFECLPKDTAKGIAMKELVKIKNWDSFTIAAAGDYNNDLEMIEYADIGFAPRNAQEVVKNAADHVTAADCNEGFIAEAIDHIEKMLCKVK